MISTKNQRISQLAGVTFNNLACYYKKSFPYDAEQNDLKWPWDISKEAWSWRCTRSTIGSPRAALISISALSIHTSASISPFMQALIGTESRQFSPGTAR